MGARGKKCRTAGCGRLTAAYNMLLPVWTTLWSATVQTCTGGGNTIVRWFRLCDLPHAVQLTAPLFHRSRRVCVLQVVRRRERHWVHSIHQEFHGQRVVFQTQASSSMSRAAGCLPLASVWCMRSDTLSETRGDHKSGADTPSRQCQDVSATHGGVGVEGGGRDASMERAVPQRTSPSCPPTPPPPSPPRRLHGLWRPSRHART